MSGDAADPRDLQGLDASAARALAFAEREAHALGHDRVGTEHLLLGLLTSASDASRLLADAGVTLAAARHKVREVVGPTARDATGASRPLPRTARVGRALGRAGRFAHTDGSDVVTSDHLLWGLLDVEGRAGQVLRGLRVEIDPLRRALQETRATTGGTETPRGAVDAVAGSARCPSCATPLEGNLTYQLATATATATATGTAESGAARAAVVFSCGTCGQVLGVGPA